MPSPFEQLFDISPFPAVISRLRDNSVIAINKRNHPAAKTLLQELRSTLVLEREGWTIPIVLTEAIEGAGIEELWAAVESHRTGEGHDNQDAIRHLGVWAEHGAIGDAAWRDAGTGKLVSHELEIPLEILHATASQLLGECGHMIRRLVAGLSMPDWPEGARRAITVSLGPIIGLTAPVFAPLESVLDRLREADGMAFDYDGD